MLTNPKVFQFKIAFSFVALTILLVAATNFLFLAKTLEIQKEDLRTYLMAVAQMGALLVDGDALSSIPLTHEASALPVYLKTQKQLQQIRDLNDRIRYVYTMVRSPRKGRTLSVVDAAPATAEEIKQGTAGLPGDEYDASRYPEMLRAFTQPSADRQLTVDEYGAILSGYAPIRNARGEVVAILGVDMEAKQVWAILGSLTKEALIAILCGMVLAILLSSWVAKAISKPILMLIHHIRYITHSKDLTHTISLQTKDEIEELANAFNQLTLSLHEANARQKELMLDMIRSFTLALEAVDPYIKGHAERVTRYAELVARKLGLPSSQINTIRKMGLLHDVGKIGVPQEILNKTIPLTDSEREAIRKHPLIGERILAPLMLLEPELALIRSHHERYDGAGYPDGLKGSQISDTVAIVSVCDAFDAMVSERPYRHRPFTQEEALREIQRCTGSQFHPGMAAAFMNLLREKMV